ncbi:MAG: LysR family transcriptional regulator [Marinobacter sp.]|nr:LysR family transcriptional regulator [Marinobacter sp.]
MIEDAFTLKKLEIFLTFMEAGTLSATAERLELSSVSVHRAIHSLEETLKCPLFSQEGRKLVPLPSALVLAEHAEQAMHVLEDGIKATRERAGVFSNQFKLGSLYSLTLSTVPKLIAGLKLRKPELNVELTLDSNRALFAKLHSLEIDAALVSLEPGQQDPQYTSLPLFNDEVLLAAPANTTLSDSQPISLSAFRAETFVTLKPDFATHRDSYQAFKRAGFDPEVIMEVEDIFSLVSLVSEGVGFALLPKRIEAVFENRIKLFQVNELKGVRQQISLVCLAKRERDPRILSCIAESRVYSAGRT